MSDYTRRSSYWQGKDSLADSDPEKIISGDDFDDEFELIETAINTKANLNGSSSEAFATSALTIGSTLVTSTAAELNILDGVTATATEINLLDGITSVNDEDDMTSDSATSLATQQSIKAYVDAQVATATMTWTYITRSTLATVSGLTKNSYTTVNISTSDVPASATAMIISIEGFGDGTSTLDMYLKSTLVSERTVLRTQAGNDISEKAGAFNTITIPYTSSIDVKYNGDGTNVTGSFFIDGYIS